MRPLLLAMLALVSTACGSLRPHVADDGLVPGVVMEDAVPEEAGADADAAEEQSRDRSLGGEILMYLPNRVIDLLDVAKVGVDVGPGIGVELKVTELAQVVALTHLSIGVGFQGLRHLPFRAGGETAIGVGPLRADAELGSWYRSATEVRLGAHLAIVGAHASVDPGEIVDFVLGLVLIDIMDDDL